MQVSGLPEMTSAERVSAVASAAEEGPDPEPDASAAAGFDDALATTIPPAELAGRLAWLDARSRAAGTSTSPASPTPPHPTPLF